MATSTYWTRTDGEQLFINPRKKWNKWCKTRDNPPRTSTKHEQDEWCTKTHGENGLTEAVINSNTTPEQAATGLLSYIRKYIPEPRKALLAGNSVHADKAFLRKEPYKKVNDHFHHRILDVSTIKEAAKRWSSPEVLDQVPKKRTLHTARDDILESIEEARYYKQAIFQMSRGVEAKKP